MTAMIRLAFLALGSAQWPPCPQPGCLPCPEHADGRPNCSCLEGYSLNGSSVEERVALQWDRVRGWLGTCEPVRCGAFPTPAYAEPLQETAVRVYPETLDYVCHPGYEVEGYTSNWFENASLNDARRLRFQCSPGGVYTNLTGGRCVPVCGDGLLVPVDHLPASDMREQCDDGNRNSGDGCDGQCRVELGFVCMEGDINQADRCVPASAWAESTMVLSMTGAREADAAEVALATALVLVEVFGTPRRDLEIHVLAAPSNGTLAQGFHTARLAMQVDFKVKISGEVSLERIQEVMANPPSFVARIVAAYLKTSLMDLYITIVEVQEPMLVGQQPKVEQWDFNDYAALVAGVGTALACYICLIGVVCPAIYWCLFVMKRPHRLQGHVQHIPKEYQDDWVLGICDWYRAKVTCCSLPCFLPARLAYTWDTVGILPYWRGVRQALLCCGFYSLGCCPCGAFIAGQRRSDLKDFLGFGDGVKSNIEVVDICYYCMCPLCSVVQEAAHVDLVFAKVRATVRVEQEKARKRLEDDNDEEQPAEAPTLQSMFDEHFNAALDTAVGALD